MNVSDVFERSPSFVNETEPDNLSRQVFGVLGIPIDVLDLATLLKKIDTATSGDVPFLISTANINFLIANRTKLKFRESLLQSDLCLADGTPVVWIARLLGIPIGERLAGSDLFDTLKSRSAVGERLKIFLFGGREGVAEIVREKLNAQSNGMQCVGTLNPGFGSIDELSKDYILEAINSSRANFLAVFLGAEKAQEWLLHNHGRLKVPVRAQFGAVINFQAGTIKRAPVFLRKIGLEWIWRIKEEPYLWRRYWTDGVELLHLLLTSALPLVAGTQWRRLRPSNGLLIGQGEDQNVIVIALRGAAIVQHVDQAIPYFRDALRQNKQILVDLSKTCTVDPRFFGLFLELRKQLGGQGRRLKFMGVTPAIKRTFRLNGFEFLLLES